ncbi:5-formyltetrahydrofolate cyclo-ligase [Candidatus Woesearchaeota archaeon]|nr:5-formyltetrahydrofolate cyclo-ligase [Candidatus Woesearchaeota archaeon]
MLNKKEKNIIVPYTAKGNLRLSELKKFSELEQKKFGILEPKKEFIRKFNLKELDLVIVPGIVFDKNRHRIGYGYGYYDRFLKNLSNHVIKIGIAFEFQLVDKIPHEMHDVAMDIVITENFILKK